MRKGFINAVLATGLLASPAHAASFSSPLPQDCSHLFEEARFDLGIKTGRDDITAAYTNGSGIATREHLKEIIRDYTLLVDRIASRYTHCDAQAKAEALEEAQAVLNEASVAYDRADPNTGIVKAY